MQIYTRPYNHLDCSEAFSREFIYLNPESIRRSLFCKVWSTTNDGGCLLLQMKMICFTLEGGN